MRGGKILADQVIKIIQGKDTSRPGYKQIEGRKILTNQENCLVKNSSTG